mgnify:CR=1 FL=1
MRLIFHLVLAITLIISSSTVFPVQENNGFQVIVPSVKVYTTPRGVSGKFITIKGGEIIQPIEVTQVGTSRYVKFLRGNALFYISDIYLGRMPQKIAPGAAFDIGRESFKKPVPYHYEPSDLTELTIYNTEGQRVFLRKEAAVAFISMAEDAKSQGINISAYRGYQSVGAYAKSYLNAASIWGRDTLPVSRHQPGLSPLHSGVHLYVTGTEIKNFIDDHFVFTRAYQWLLENSQYYGFEFMKFTNDLDYRPYMMRYTGRNSLIFRVQKTPPYSIGFKNESIAIKKFQRPGLNVAYLVIHDNENSATDAMKYALKKYGGYGAELVNLLRINKRNIGIRVGSRLISVDPNRIFTEENALLDMGFWNRTIHQSAFKKALVKILDIREAILNNIFLKEKRYLLALHSNSPHGRLSIHTFVKHSIRNNYHIYVNPAQNRKAFFYVVSYDDFLYFKKRKMNVVCLKTWNPQDGSLAFIAHKNKIPYITIECAEGDNKNYRILLDAAMDLVKIRLKAWSR